ncbi:hypothetical protein BDW74DRAFT_158173 [Aspergillus multicolor]|uniref:nucleic acid-binding protein n=1 Tax=Aspergillus multicolor TaxID=41759 RepID=UPI003CCD0D46
MYSVRRVACRLLASPAPIVRSRLTAVPRAHRPVIARRTFLHSRWTAGKARSPLGSQDVAAPSRTKNTATATDTGGATTIKTLTDDSLDSPSQGAEAKVQEDGGAGGDMYFADSNPTTSVDTKKQPEGLDQSSAVDEMLANITRMATRSDDEWDAEQDFDISQIREAAAKEAMEVAQDKFMTHSEKLELLRRLQYEPRETVFIGNLFYDVTAEDLRKQMAKYGVVEMVNIIYDSRGISKGYGYVQFSNNAAAKRAIDAMHLRIFEGRRVTVYYAQTNIKNIQQNNKPSNTLYIGNLPFEMTDRDLNDLVKDLVGLVDVRVTVDRETGTLRGYIHAEFLDIQAAMVAQEKLAQRKPYGRRLVVNYSSNTKTGQGRFPVAV